MNARRPLSAIALLATIGLLDMACQTASPAPAALPDADQAAIRQSVTPFVKAVSDRDFAAFAAWYAEDAILLPPEGPLVQGRAAIQAWAAAFPPFTDFTLQQVEVDGRADLAYVRGTYAMTIAVPGAPAPVQDRGKYIEIWRKQADGTWKIARDMFNSDLPAAAPSPPEPPKN